jgi:hypothetical protein
MEIRARWSAIGGSQVAAHGRNYGDNAPEKWVVVQSSKSKTKSLQGNKRNYGIGEKPKRTKVSSQ